MRSRSRGRGRGLREVARRARATGPGDRAGDARRADRRDRHEPQGARGRARAKLAAAEATIRAAHRRGDGKRARHRRRRRRAIVEQLTGQAPEPSRGRSGARPRPGALGRPDDVRSEAEFWVASLLHLPRDRLEGRRLQGPHDGPRHARQAHPGRTRRGQAPARGGRRRCSPTTEAGARRPSARPRRSSRPRARRPSAPPRRRTRHDGFRRRRTARRRGQDRPGRRRRPPRSAPPRPTPRSASRRRSCASA